MSVLILADAEDPTAGRVAAELAGRGVQVHAVDPAGFPQRLRLAAAIEPGAAWSGCIGDITGAEVDLAGVRAVYYRKPTQFRMPDGMSQPERLFAYGEARRGFGGVLMALGECLWVNDPVTAARCEYKPIQLAAAAAVGLPIPPTIITSDPRHAHQWAMSLRRPVIYKPLSGTWHADESQVRFMFTTPVQPADLLDASFSWTAQLLQPQIRRQTEARAMVVADTVLTVRIDNNEPGEIDWRASYGHHDYEPIALPEDVTARLIALHQRLGLVYGAADLILDADTGQWTFLETNCNGEWAWLADETGIEVASRLADLLQEGHL